MSGQNLYDLFKTVDVLVISPACTDDLSRDIVRELRLAKPSDPLAVAARYFHEVLSLIPDSYCLPLFSGSNGGPSMFKSAVRHAADDPDVEALSELSDAQAMLAYNIARWLLGHKQQPFTPAPSVVMSGPPAASQVMDLTQMSRHAVAS